MRGSAIPCPCFSEASSAASSARELAAQRGDLLVEQLDLRQRAGGQRSSARRAAPVKLADLALRRGGAAADALVQPLQAVALAFGAGEAGAQLRELLLEIELAGLLQRQQLGQLRDLRVEPLQRRVLAGDFLRQEELHDHEHREQEHDAEEQRRQRVDEARPVIRCRVRGASCERVAMACTYLRDVLAHQHFEQAADLALLLGLRLDPVADHLLLGAHVLDQALDRLGEIGHGGGRGLARAGFGDRLAQLLDRAAHLADGDAARAARSRSTPRSRTVVESQSSSSV